MSSTGGAGLARYLAENSDVKTISDDQPYVLRKNDFILARTVERVHFPITEDTCYAARVEGRSSLARTGLLVHFTAPTVHSGFEGTITLEMINLGFADFTLKPGLSICQLVIEQVSGTPNLTPSDFRGQSTAGGL